MVRDPEGTNILAKITKGRHKDGTPVYSWAIFREFRRESGEVSLTSFLNNKQGHFDAVMRVIVAVQGWIRETLAKADPAK